MRSSRPATEPNARVSRCWGGWKRCTSGASQRWGGPKRVRSATPHDSSSEPQPTKRSSIVTDKAVYRQLAKQAITRTVDELRARATVEAQGKRASTAKRDRTPREEADVEHRANLRELTRQAHGVDLDLGRALLEDLAAVAPDDIDVTRSSREVVP